MCRSAPTQVVLACVYCFAIIASVSAHGGGLHRWTLNSDVLDVLPHAPLRSDYAPWIRAAVATNWTVLNTSNPSTVSNYHLPTFDPPNNNVTVKGSIGLYVYLRNNCTEGAQTTAIVDLWLHRHERKNGMWSTRPYGQPHKHVQVYGYAFTGTCDAPGNLYRNDPSREDDRFNLIYWNKENVIGYGMNETDGENGYLWGAAPNSYLLRGPEQAGDGPVPMSFVLVVQGAATFCAPFEWVADPAGVFEWGQSCA